MNWGIEFNEGDWVVVEVNQNEVRRLSLATDQTTFESLLGSSPETYDQLRKYVGPNGEISYIAFKDGNLDFSLTNISIF